MEPKKKQVPNLRAREETRRQLKLVAALTGESMLAVLDRLVKAELKRVQQERGKDAKEDEGRTRL